MTGRRARRTLAASVVTAYVGLQVLGRTAGTTARERRARMPGDDVVIAPTIVTDHAVTIPSPPERIWPWLTQLGWHRAGWYTPRWVDRLLFPQNWPSLDRLDPELVRDLRVGDTIPDGPPGTAWYEVDQVSAPHTLVLHSTTHVPGSWRERFGARIDWTWAFALRQSTPGATRLHLRVRGRTAPWMLTVLYQAAVVPADYVMAVGMLRGLRSRVRADAPTSGGLRTRP